MIMNPSPAQLDAVFGSDAIGVTPEERASSSNRTFVRGQVQLAPFSEGATGRQFTALEALLLYGWETLEQATLEGAATILSQHNEPAGTLRRRREALGLEVDSIAKYTGIPVADLRAAETVGVLSRIHVLERIAKVLALDESRLGVQGDAGGDVGLGIRLRRLLHQNNGKEFSPSTVMKLSEAAWVIQRQSKLSLQLDSSSNRLLADFGYSDDYRRPVWDAGYRLAAMTRAQLGMDDLEPITSVRRLVEDTLGVPLVQDKLGLKFAGATIANGQSRGIVVNEDGANGNPLIRRMTLCHELGHLLWDSDEQLEQLKVDEYSGIGQSPMLVNDPIEARANAFAIEFLAPHSAVLDVYRTCGGDFAQTIEIVSSRYGISVPAASYHLANVLQIRREQLPRIHEDDDSSLLWLVAENLMADQLLDIPLSRRGKFAWLVSSAVRKKLISIDSAASYLALPKKVVASRLLTIEELWTGGSDDA